jgi:hypothetical protein
MSLLSSQELTTQQKQLAVAGRIQKSSSFLFRQMANTYANIYTDVWVNPDLTPQEVFDSLGASGAELLALADVLSSTVNGVVPGTIETGYPYEYTINEDGTVTIGDLIETSSSSSSSVEVPETSSSSSSVEVPETSSSSSSGE